MFLPTPTGVIEAQAYEGKGFGTLDISADPVVLEPCKVTLAAYTGSLVTVLGVLIPATVEVALPDRSWKAAGALVAGDSILNWTRGDGLMESWSVSDLAASQGSTWQVTAAHGALLGASSTGPWILVR